MTATASASDSPLQRQPLLRFFKAPEWGLVCGILAVLALIYKLDSQNSFFQAITLQTMLHTVARFGVLAIGAAVVIIAGGIDLSAGAVVALSSVFSAKLLTEWLRSGDPTAAPPSAGLVAVAIALTLLLGLAIGLFHALMINQFRLPPFIATLATMAGLRSVAILLSHSTTINVSFDSYRMWGSDYRYTLLIFAFVAIFMSVLMGWTVLGRHLFALGGNEVAARLSGLRTKRLKTIAYGISGTLSALAGILFTGKDGAADSQMGVSYELIAITAAVVGGCSLSGGVGSIRGTVLGLLLTQIVIKGTSTVVRWVDAYQIEGLVLGTVVLIAVAFNQRFRGPRG